jgi:Copper transport outer membrane protein, MctB
VIDFRFLLTTIVAVFLALAIGLLMGSGLLSPVLRENLQRDLEDLRTRENELEDRNRELNALIGAQETFGMQLQNRLIAGELAGDQVVLFRVEGTEGELIDRTRDAIELADGVLITTITLKDAMTMEDDQATAELMTRLGITPGDDEELATVIGRELGARAADAERGQSRSLTIMLDALADGGFVDVETDGDVVVPLGAHFVVAAGAEGDAPFELEGFGEALLGELAQGPLVVAIEGYRSDWGFVPTLRSSDVRDAVSTVDHGDTVPGSVSIIEELDRLPTSNPAHYGFKEGADGVAPGPSTGG